MGDGHWAPRRTPRDAAAELSLQAERGSVHTQASLLNAFTRINGAEAILGELIEALAENDVIRPEQVPLAIKRFAPPDERPPQPPSGPPPGSSGSPSGPPRNGNALGSRPPMDPAAAEREADQKAMRWPGVVLRQDAPDAEAPAVVDCAARMPICHAVCCSLQFPLSAEEVDAGKVRWDLGHPYMIRDSSDGYCCHNDPQSGSCTVYEDRPQVCRGYSCAGDTRIWSDFDGMVLNHQWLDEHLGRDRRVRVSIMASQQGDGDR